jgi:hypothetical protein
MEATIHRFWSPTKNEKFCGFLVCSLARLLIRSLARAQTAMSSTPFQPLTTLPLMVAIGDVDEAVRKHLPPPEESKATAAILQALSAANSALRDAQAGEEKYRERISTLRNRLNAHAQTEQRAIVQLKARLRAEEQTRHILEEELRKAVADRALLEATRTKLLHEHAAVCKVLTPAQTNAVLAVLEGTAPSRPGTAPSRSVTAPLLPPI